MLILPNQQNGKAVNPTKAAKVSTTVFFLFHYGFFHFVYGLFLAAFPKILNEEKNTGFFIYYFLQ